MDRPDLDLEREIRQMAIRWAPGTPGVEATGGDLEQAAHRANGIHGLVGLHEPEDFFGIVPVS